MRERAAESGSGDGGQAVAGHVAEELAPRGEADVVGCYGPDAVPVEPGREADIVDDEVRTRGLGAHVGRPDAFGAAVHDRLVDDGMRSPEDVGVLDAVLRAQQPSRRQLCADRRGVLGLHRDDDHVPVAGGGGGHPDRTGPVTIGALERERLTLAESLGCRAPHPSGDVRSVLGEASEKPATDRADAGDQHPCVVVHVQGITR